MADSNTSSGSCDAARIERLENKVSKTRFWLAFVIVFLVAALAFVAGRASGRCCAMREMHGNGGPQGNPCPLGMNCGPQGSSSQQSMGCFNRESPGPNGGPDCCPSGGPKSGPQSGMFHCPSGGPKSGPQSGMFQFGPGMNGPMKVLTIRAAEGNEEGGDAPHQMRRDEEGGDAPTPPAAP